MSKVTIIRSLVSSIWISVGCWLIFPATLLAKSEPTTLYLQPIPYYMEAIEQGTYVDLMQRFSKDNNHDFVYLMASSERIEKLLVRGEEDYCSLGFSVELATTEGLPTGHLIESQSFNRIYTSILPRRETPVENVKGLNNKTLVVYHGNYQDAAQRIPEGFDTSIVTV